MPNSDFFNSIERYILQQAELGGNEVIFVDVPKRESLDYAETTHLKVQENFEEIYLRKRKALVELYKITTGCKGCSLGSRRKNLVFGSGKADAPVMVIGEAPGREEDEQGLPFVGRAGQLLTKMLAAINLDRNRDVFIGNILKCRPPNNRNPELSEVVACLPYLKQQIAIIEPIAILLLGRIAVSGLIDMHESIAKLRGQIYHYNNRIPVMVTYHPAALLRNPSYKKLAWEDLQRFRDMIKEKGVYELIEKKKSFYKQKK